MSATIYQFPAPPLHAQRIQASLDSRLAFLEEEISLATDRFSRLRNPTLKRFAAEVVAEAQERMVEILRERWRLFAAGEGVARNG